MNIEEYLSRYVYRIIHMDSLASVLSQGTFASRHVPPPLAGDSFRFIADPALVEERNSVPVPLALSRTLGDYVPFYFGRRSPMLYKISQGGKAELQREIVYVCLKIRDIVEAKLDWCFTDAHANSLMARYFDRPDQLLKLNWAAIDAMDYRDSTKQPNAKALKQAELLVWKHVPASLIALVGTFDEASESKAQQIVLNCGVDVAVRAARDHTSYYR